MIFNNAKEMLDLLQSGTDLYNVRTGDYVFLYSDKGAIATYNFDVEYAKDLSERTIVAGEESWSGLLGFGGSIYEEGSELKWCEEHYNETGWESTSALDKEWNRKMIAVVQHNGRYFIGFGLTTNKAKQAAVDEANDFCGEDCHKWRKAPCFSYGDISTPYSPVKSRFCIRYLNVVCIDVIEIEIMPDHVHLLMEVDPQFGTHKAVKQIKGRTSRILRQEFSWLRSRFPSLWTNSYFVSTVGGAPLSVIKQYIEPEEYMRYKDGIQLQIPYLSQHRTDPSDTPDIWMLSLCLESLSCAANRGIQGKRKISHTIHARQ